MTARSKSQRPATTIRAPADEGAATDIETSHSHKMPGLYMFYVASWGALLGAIILGFQASQGQAYASVDGEWAAWNVTSIMSWSHFFTTGPLNFFGGIGSTYVPNLPWLNPAAAVLSLHFPRESLYLISYIIYALEVGFSVFFLCRVLGLSMLLCNITGQLHILLFFPPFYDLLLNSIPNYLLAPVNAHLVCLFNISMALFLLVGRQTGRINIGICLAIIASAITLLVSAPFTALTYVPAYVTSIAAILLADIPRRFELRWKAFAAAATIFALWLIGAPDYLAGVSSVTARANLIGSQLLQPFNSRDLSTSILHACDRPTMSLLCMTDSSLPLSAIALAGASVTVVTAAKALRNLGIWFICFLVLVNIYSGPSNFFFNDLPAVRAEFLFWSAYTFFGLFIALLPVGLLAFCRQVFTLPSFEWARTQATARRLHNAGIFLIPLIAFLIIPWRSFHPIWPPRAVGEFRYLESSQGPIIQYLAQNASLRDGGPFRGYTATFFTDPSGAIREKYNFTYSTASWQFNNHTRYYFYEHYNNTFQETGLWRFSIPTLEDYGQAVTYQAFVFMEAFLAPPRTLVSGQFDIPGLSDDTAVLSPQFFRIYSLDISLLRSLGVRYLISDMTITDPQVMLAVTERNENAASVFLYELARPNLGTYSPQRIERVNSMSESIEWIRGNAERERNAVVDGEIINPLWPVQEVLLSVKPGGFRVKARSMGKSAVLLPFQFSNCLAAKSLEGDPSPRLLRANLIQTLLVFERGVEVEIDFHFGLFGPKSCRLLDGFEMGRLNRRHNTVQR